MRFNYFSHFFLSILITAIVAIICGAIGHVFGHLEYGFIAGLGIGGIYFVFGVVTGLYYARKYRNAVQRVNRVSEESLGRMTDELLDDEEMERIKKEAEEMFPGITRP